MCLKGDRRMIIFLIKSEKGDQETLGTVRQHRLKVLIYVLGDQSLLATFHTGQAGHAGKTLWGPGQAMPGPHLRCSLYPPLTQKSYFWEFLNSEESINTERTMAGWLQLQCWPARRYLGAYRQPIRLDVKMESLMVKFYSFKRKLNCYLAIW